MSMKKIFAVLAFAAAVFTMASCEKYEDGRPDRGTIREFEQMYPDAWDIEWEFEGLYWEVSFETGKRPNGIEHTAWYDMSGNWVMTKTELPFMSVPQEIKDYLAASEFGNNRLEDHFVDFYETVKGNYYRFDIYLDGREVEVDVHLDGKVALAGYDY